MTEADSNAGSGSARTLEIGHYVLHCFQKKSPSGIRTAKADIDLIHERLRQARNHHEEQYGQDN